MTMGTCLLYSIQKIAPKVFSNRLGTTSSYLSITKRMSYFSVWEMGYNNREPPSRYLFIGVSCSGRILLKLIPYFLNYVCINFHTFT